MQQAFDRKPFQPSFTIVPNLSNIYTYSNCFQVQQLMKLSSRQVRMLSALSPNQVELLSELSEQQIELLVQLEPEKLETLNQIDDQTLKQLSALDPAKVKQLGKLSSKQVDQLSQLSEAQIETLLQVPPGFDFSKIPSDLNNLNFDTAVTLLDNVDPNDLPILADDEYYDDYYDDDYTERKLRHIQPFIPSEDFYSQKSWEPMFKQTNKQFTKKPKQIRRLQFNSIQVS